MKVGTKSLLFGYHQFLLHPLMVWAAWIRLYGWTWDPRVVLSFFLHDVGYWGKPNMDGVEGKQHPFAGAHALSLLFDWTLRPNQFGILELDPVWYKFSLYHSRTMCKTYFGELSKLGYADKLAFDMYPDWLIRILGGLSGENKEYIATSTADSTTPCAPIPFDEWVHQAKLANLKTLKGAWPKPCR